MRIIKLDNSNVFKLTTVSSRWLGETKTAIPVTVESGTKQIMEWLANPSCAIFALVDDLTDGFPYVGFLACQIYPYPFSKEKMVGELAWYVMPEYRGHGLHLVQAMKEFGLEHGASGMTMHILTTAGADGGARAFAALEKGGFKELERVFYKPITCP